MDYTALDSFYFLSSLLLEDLHKKRVIRIFFSRLLDYLRKAEVSIVTKTSFPEMKKIFTNKCGVTIFDGPASINNVKCY